MNQPLVSIIVPTWNMGQYITEFFASLLDQTYRKFDLYILDDGSDDNTKLIIKEFERISKRTVKYFYCDDPTRIFRMKWISHLFADGEILFFPDSDDVLLPDAIEKYVDKFVQYSNLDFMYGSSVMIDNNGNVERFIEAKYPQELICTNFWAPYFNDNHTKFRFNAHELNGMPYTSIVHCSRDNIQIISLPFALRKTSVLKIDHSRLRVEMSKGDDLEFLGKCEYLGLKYYAMKDLVYVKRGHDQRMSDTASKFEFNRSTLSWPDSIEKARDLADNLRTDHFITNNFHGLNQVVPCSQTIEAARQYFVQIQSLTKTIFK